MVEFSSELKSHSGSLSDVIFGEKHRFSTFRTTIIIGLAILFKKEFDIGDNLTWQFYLVTVSGNLIAMRGSCPSSSERVKPIVHAFVSLLSSFGCLVTPPEMNV